MKRAMLAVALILSFTGISHAQDQRGRFNDIRTQEQAAPAAAFDAMTVLAEEGYAPALDRVAYYFRQGIGTTVNLTAAQHWYVRAVAAGHPWSTASLARVEIKQERGDAALILLQAGVAKDLPGTQRLLATAHIDRQLGRKSDPAQGRAMLERMVSNGDANAARDLAVRVNWGRLDGPISEAATKKVVQAGLDGDVRFAEAALVYLSGQNNKSADVLATRALLAETSGMRDRVLSVELIRLAAAQAPGRFWAEVEGVLLATDPENYARAASTAFWINKNSWVRMLQIELRALGYYNGRINALMTARTISAQNRLCADHDIWSICAAGPLRGTTVRAVAGVIAIQKLDDEL